MTYAGLVTIEDSRQPHLGGNVLQGDPFTYGPAVWDYVVKRFCIESVLDLGSGIGNAAAYFHHMGLKVVAVEGAMPNVTRSFYPAVCHDLSVGPVKTKVDLVHCQEVVEHVEARYLEHVLDSLVTGRVILLTHAVPGDGGHHHVNEQPAEYWIDHIRRRHYTFLEEDTDRIRKLAVTDGARYLARTGLLFSRASLDLDSPGLVEIPLSR